MAEQVGHVGAFYIPRRDCVFFDGVLNDRIEVTDAPTLDFTAGQSLSLTMWLRLPANAAVTPILDKGLPLGSGWRLHTFVPGDLGFSIDSAGSGIRTAQSVALLDDDAWHFVVAMRDGATGRLWLYIDAVADPAGGAAGYAGTLANATDLVFGNVAGGGSNTDEMYIGETHLYGTLLTPAQITALYNGGDGIWSQSGPNTRALWQMREGAGVTVSDVGTNVNPGTITGATWVTHAQTVVGEVVAGAGVTWTLANQNVEVATVYDTAVPLGLEQYTVTVKGVITLTAPAGGAITADYDYYIVSQCGGFHEWNLDFANEAPESTKFADAGIKSFIPGMQSWSGTAQRFWVHPGFIRDCGERMIVKFWYDEANDKRLEGWGIMTGGAPSVAPDTVIEEAITFTGTEYLSPEIV